MKHFRTQMQKSPAYARVFGTYLNQIATFPSMMHADAITNVVCCPGGLVSRPLHSIFIKCNFSSHMNGHMSKYMLNKSDIATILI